MPSTIHAEDFPDFTENNHYEGANNENVNCLAFYVVTDYTKKQFKQSTLNKTKHFLIIFQASCLIAF